MDYNAAMNVIAGRRHRGAPRKLSRMQALCALLGDPQKGLRFVHVAGTNGKGSACALLASVLRESGLRTGLYTSPYVLEFRERFQIDGAMISREEVARLAPAVDAAARKVEAQGETVTEFEFITAMAFLWFAERHCDAVVLEVGVGGRVDATNVIDVPEAAVLMSVSPDHTAVLGDSPAQIAREKVGIVKPGGRLVLYPEQPDGVAQTVALACREQGAQLFWPERSALRETAASLLGTEFLWKGLVLRTPFLGEHQVKNAATVLKTLEVLRGRGWNIPDDAVRRGFARAFLPARMEIVSRQPLVLLDGGHNPGCAHALADALARFVPDGRHTAILGMMEDKDWREYLRVLAPLFETVVCTAPDAPRALEPELLAQAARSLGCEAVTAAGGARHAVALAKERMGSEERALVVCGSFYLAAELRPLLRESWGR